MSVPFSEWTREEKDEFARRRMDEMKLLNEKYKQRHAEVEKDRKKAEEKNSSVTSVLSSKEKSELNEDHKAEADICSKPKVKEREWDRGKSNLDMEDWSTHKHYQRRQANWKDYSDKRPVRKDESWRANSSQDYHSSSRFRDSGRSWGNRKNDSQNYRNDTFSNQRGRGYNRERGNYTSYRSFHNSKLSDTRKKTLVGAGGSTSRSPSESEKEPIKHSTKFENDRMWRDGGTNEVRHRQIRVEKWVKSINSACLEDVDNLNASKPQEVEYQYKSWPKYDLADPGCNEGKKIDDLKISDPEGIWEDLDQGVQYLYQSSDKANNPPQFESTRLPDKKTTRKDDDEYIQSRMQKDKQWKCEYHSKHPISSGYSGTYENQGFKKQNDRRSNWKKPDSHFLRKGKYVESKSRHSSSSRRFEDGNPSGDNCEWSSHELESSDSVLVKIESHTVKRTVFNTFGDTKRDTQHSLPDNELLDYPEKEIETDVNPIQGSKNIQRNIESGIWDECDYDDIQHSHPENELLDYPEKEIGRDVNPIQSSKNIQRNVESGIWDECDYNDIQYPKSFQQKKGSDSSELIANAYSKMDNADCDIYQMEAVKLHSSNGNESEYANTKVIQSEMGDLGEDSFKKNHFDLQNVGEILAVKNDNVTEEINKENLLNIELLDMQDIATKSLEDIVSRKTVNILNPDDDQDIQYLDTINPEIVHGAAKNLEDVEFVCASDPLGISADNEILIAPINDCNTKELDAETYAVTQDFEIPMEQTNENLNLEHQCPFAKSSRNISATCSDEDHNSSSAIIETSEKQVIEPSIQKGHVLVNELPSEVKEENICTVLEATNTLLPPSSPAEFPSYQIDNENKSDDLQMLEANASISKEVENDKHLKKLSNTPDDSLPE